MSVTRPRHHDPPGAPTAPSEQPLASSDERDLIRRCRAGDELAWAVVYRTPAPRVGRFVRRLINPDPASLDDLVQQIFVELYSSIDRFRGDARLSTWLYGIARHVAYKHVRSEKRRRRRRDAFAASDPDRAIAASGEGAAEARAELQQLRQLVERLDERHRAVWVMRELEGLTTEEVAEALDLRPGTVRSRLFHARKRIMAQLAREQAPARRAEGERTGSHPAFPAVTGVS